MKKSYENARGWFQRWRGALHAHPVWWFLLGVVVTEVIYAILLRFDPLDWLKLSPPVSFADARDVALVGAALAAAWFALWRTWISEKQSATQLRTLLHERFQEGVEMLGSRDVAAVRLGGVYVLQYLAREHPGIYYLQVSETLCAFVRNPTATDEAFEGHRARPDVQAAMQTICGFRRRDIERAANYRPNLTSGHLNGTTLDGLDLSSCDFAAASFVETSLILTDLSDATFIDAFHRWPAIGLTQEQLDEAEADKEKQPELFGVIDAFSRQPLEWKVN